MGDKKVKKRTERLRVRNSVELDHQPVEVEVKGRWGKRMKDRERRIGWRECWGEERRAEVEERLGRVNTGEKDREVGRVEVERKIGRSRGGKEEAGRGTKREVNGTRSVGRRRKR